MSDDDRVTKTCPECDYSTKQDPEARVWHWCGDGEKREMTAEGSDAA